MSEGKVNAYVKGGLVAAFLILGCVGGWVVLGPSLGLDGNPRQYDLLSKMERDGVPMLELPGLDGGSIDLQTLKGKVVIVNFWASWCNPCVEEFPSLMRLLKAMNGDVELVAVSVDEDRSDIESFLKAFGVRDQRMHVALDPKRVAASAWGVGKIPESFLVGPDGKLIRKVMGIEDWSSAGALSYFRELVAKSDAKASP